MGNRFVVASGIITTTAAAGPKTAVLVKPAATVPFKLLACNISFGSAASAVAEVQIDLYRATTYGTPAGTALTPSPMDDSMGASNATALSALTTEPTTKVILESWLLQPLAGMPLFFQMPLGAEYRAVADALGLQWTTPSSVSPTLSVNTQFEE